MAKYIFPAVFTKDGDFYVVSFPDIDGCNTQGESIQDALEMAEDVLCLTLYGYEEDGEKIPKPSDPKEIETDDSSFVSLIACDTIEYRKFYDNKAVKKTLTIPAWLNTISEREGVNFSAVLQNALKKELHISD